MTRFHPSIIGLILIAGVWFLGCETDGTQADTAFPTGDAVVQQAGLTPWSPGAGTTAVPTYGKTCRLATENNAQYPSNNAPDDSFQLSASNDGATLTVVVNTANGQVLNAQVSLTRGLKDKSFRQATGQASWGLAGQSGTVVDGTACFPERLKEGTATPLEFSLILDDGLGTYHSVSGHATVPGSAISTAPSTQVNAMTLDIGLD